MHYNTRLSIQRNLLISNDALIFNKETYILFEFRYAHRAPPKQKIHDLLIVMNLRWLIPIRHTTRTRLVPIGRGLYEDEMASEIDFLMDNCHQYK